MSNDNFLNIIKYFPIIFVIIVIFYLWNFDVLSTGEHDTNNNDDMNLNVDNTIRSNYEQNNEGYNDNEESITNNTDESYTVSRSRRRYNPTRHLTTRSYKAGEKNDYRTQRHQEEYNDDNGYNEIQIIKHSEKYTRSRNSSHHNIEEKINDETSSGTKEPPTKTVKDNIGGGYSIPPNVVNVNKKQYTDKWISVMENEISDIFSVTYDNIVHKNAMVKYSSTNGYMNVTITNDYTKYDYSLDVVIPNRMGKLNIYVDYIGYVSDNITTVCITNFSPVINSSNIKTNSYIHSISIDKIKNCSLYDLGTGIVDTSILNKFSTTDVTIYYRSTIDN